MAERTGKSSACIPIRNSTEMPKNKNPGVEKNSERISDLKKNTREISEITSEERNLWDNETRTARGTSRRNCWEFCRRISGKC